MWGYFMKEIKEFYKHLNKINELQYVIGILDWELKVNIPNDTVSEINNLLAKYNVDLFKLKTSKKYGNLLNKIVSSKYFEKLGLAERKHIKKLYKEYKNLVCVPIKFYKQYLKIGEEVNQKFDEAVKKNDGSIVLPYLDKMVEETKKMYAFRDNIKSIYDAMLDDFEEGMTTKEIDELFSKIKKTLIPFVKKNKSSNRELKYNFTDKQLKDAAILLLSYIGFDFNKGDTVVYQNAFTTRLGFKDVRITFNNNENPCCYASTVIHEGGHALVEANIGPEYLKYASVSLASLTGLHESQSRFFENILGRNKNFWVPIYPKLKKILKLDLTLDEFIGELNTIKPGMIRLDADEVSYCLHIIIRYEIERDLFQNKISTYDIPRVWKKLYKEYLDIDVIDDANGFLQDVHWSQGNFGYFPSYLLGTIYDGMLIAAVECELGSIDDILASGKVKVITEYLKDNIYKYGGAFSSVELLSKLCGERISSKYILDYFKGKYI